MPNSFAELYLNQLLTRCEHKLSGAQDEYPIDQVGREGSLGVKTSEFPLDPIVHLKMISVGTNRCSEEIEHLFFHEMSPACS